MKRGRRKPPPPEVREIPLAELYAIVERAGGGPLREEDRTKLRAALETLGCLTREIEAKNASMRRLKKILFGSRTEKTREVLGDKEQGKTSADLEPTASDSKKPSKAKRKGHGRNGSAAYHGANQIQIPHARLQHGGRCPACEQGNVYEQKNPSMLVRVTGIAPIHADVYARERLRCGACGKVFTASAPPGVGAKKYDESVSAMVALLKYSAGVPFHRLEKLQAGLGIPLPAGTQWQLVEEAFEAVEPVYRELIRQAAQARVIHHDDTTMRILHYDVEALAEARREQRKRTGTFTTGIIAKAAEHETALFYTGWHHAGENLAKVLSHREEALAAPIQMCDALSRNMSGELATLVANCIAHARRRFVDVVENFPEECRHVLETLRQVYRNDAVAREQKMTPEVRLRYHQTHSGPLMEAMESWLREQFDERKVEPNSGLGEAIQYMQNHWRELTLFLREPGAPLDNNICERALKKAILHRKNSYFFKTENGARVGDIFMSLIHTVELNHENPFEYLVALQRHAGQVKKNPSNWMPWTFRQALKDRAPPA